MTKNDQSNILLQAFIDARNEKDRTLFLSSVGGIGFNAAMLFGQHGAILATLLMISLVLFSLSAGAVLLAFHHNANYLSKLINDENASTNDSCLTWIDRVVSISFVFAVLSVGASIVVHLSTGGIQ